MLSEIQYPSYEDRKDPCGKPEIVGQYLLKPEREEEGWEWKKKISTLMENVREVVHDLNNPIAAIILCGQLLAAKAVDPETKEDLEKIVRQAERVSQIVKDLAVFAKRSNEEKECGRQAGMMRRKEGTYAGCSFSWEKLKEMEDNGAEFWTADNLSLLRIVEIDEKQKSIYIINQTGKITWPLKYQKLEEVHEKVHSGKVAFTPSEIDKLVPTWGTYIVGLLKYLGCDKVLP